MADSKRCLSDDDRTPSTKKRKYRKHPKPDLNTPKKPSPSAYHLFALEQGEKLRKKGYGFEEIARETGSRWRALSPQTVKDLELKTTQAKNQYRKSLAAYKKSPDYKAYQEYLKRWMAKEEAKKKYILNPRIEAPSPPPRSSPTTTEHISSPASSNDGTLGLEWTDGSSNHPIDADLSAFWPESWTLLPGQTTSEQLEWKWSGDYGVTLAPDPLFPTQNPKNIDLFDPLPTWLSSSTIAPSMLADSHA